MYLSFDVLARELGRNLPIQTYNVTQRQVISDIQVLTIPFLPGSRSSSLTPPTCATTGNSSSSIPTWTCRPSAVWWSPM